MQYLVFEMDSKEKVQEVLKKLWEHYGVTGEVQVMPLGQDKWRLEISSEKELREATLEKFAEFRVEAGDD